MRDKRRETGRYPILAALILLGILGSGFDAAAYERWVPPGERTLAEREMNGEIGANPFRAPLPVAALEDPDDVNWWDGFGPQQLDGPVLASVLFEGQIVVGGDFFSANGETVFHVARWDGTRWAPVGDGFNESVFALAVWNGQLVAGGRFTRAGQTEVSRIAIWNGSEWTPLGEGFDHDVLSLADIDGELHAGGHFFFSGETSVPTLGVWNGSEWAPAHGGLFGGTSPHVSTISKYGDLLLVGGRFSSSTTGGVNNIAVWAGEVWVTIGGGTNERVYTATAKGDSLYVGGLFTRAGNTGAKYVALWDGKSWNDIGGGMDNPVLDLVHLDDTLYAGGHFSTAGDTTAQFIAALDENDRWTSMDSQMDGSVTTLTVVDGELHVGGVFLHASGTQTAHWARHTGERFAALGADIDNTVTAMTLFDGKLVAGGNFTRVDGVNANRVAMWDGSNWMALGAGFDDEVRSLAVYNDQLFATGSFTHTDTFAINYLASWDGNRWNEVSGGLDQPGRTLRTMGPDLLVGGSFTRVGIDAGVVASRIARWNGDSWSSVSLSTLNAEVRTITFFNGAIHIGGAFTQSGARQVSRIGKLVESEWEALGFGTDGTVNRLFPFQDKLLAAGEFTQADSAKIALIALWDPAKTAWEPLEASIALRGAAVEDVLKRGDALIAGGNISVPVGDSTATFIATWADGNWSRLGTGVDGIVSKLFPYEDDLMVGGAFTSAGGRLSPFIARWMDLQPTPVFLERFTADRDGAAVVVQWSMSEAIDHAGFHLYRGDTQIDSRITTELLQAREDGSYEFLDRTAPSGEALYWLEEVSRDGDSLFFGPILVARAPAIPEIEIDWIAPNPFSSTTRIRLSLSSSQDVLAEVFDVTGRRVRSILDQGLEAGPHSLEWNAIDDRGHRVAPGVYWLRVRGERWSRTGRLLVMR